MLLERGNLLARVRRILVVDCPEDVQVERVARAAASRRRVRAIMATQLPRAQRLARADDVIDNSGPRGALAPQVARLHAQYRTMAAAQAALEPHGASPQNVAQPRDDQGRLIRYEHPLNERVRTLMRLEDLFARAGYFAAQDAAQDHHGALLALFEITDVAARADLKTDLLQELERQKQMLSPLRQNPQIDHRALDELLGRSMPSAGSSWRRRARSARICARTNG